MKKKRKLFVLISLLAVLCIAYGGILLYQKHQQELKTKQEEKELEESKIYLTDFDSISRISYNNGKEVLSFVKEENTWYYENDKNFPLEQSYLITLEDQLLKMEATRSLEDGDTLQAYGLAEETLYVTVAGEDGEEVTILIGNENTLGYYAKLEDNDLVYIITSSLYSNIQNGLYDMIVMETIPSITEDNITSFSITQGNNTKLYRKAIKDIPEEESTALLEETEEVGAEDEMSETIYEWTVEQNGSVEDVTDTFEDTILYGILNLNYTECVNYNASKKELETYGLLDSTVSIKVNYEEDAKEKSFTLKIGNEEETGMYYYVQMEGSTAVNLQLKSNLDLTK